MLSEIASRVSVRDSRESKALSRNIDQGFQFFLKIHSSVTSIDPTHVHTYIIIRYLL